MRTSDRSRSRKKFKKVRINAVATDLGDLLPGWRDRSLEDVGGELKGEPGESQSRVAQPDIAFLVAYARKSEPSAPATKASAVPITMTISAIGR